MRRMGSLLAVLAALACAAGAHAGPTLTDTLKAHLNTFITNNYPGAMTYTVTEHETISGGSDLDALADLITANWHVIDTTASQYVPITASGQGRQRYIDEILKPRMENGALVARVDWVWGANTATEYALVANGATAGDVTSILEGIAGWFRKPGSGLMASSVEYDYENGYGMHVAHFEASIGCDGGICVPHVHAWAALPGENVQDKHKEWCENNKCIMDVAFVGYSGFPDVEFDAKEYKFKVSGWGWQWHTSFDRLTIDCPCTPKAEPIGVNTIGDALNLPDETRIMLADKSVTRSLPQYGVGWLEENDRSAAVRVAAEHPLEPGQVVTLTGTLYTSGASRLIEADQLTPEQAFHQVRPVYMRHGAIGGGDRNEHTLGITGGSGLNNIGLLVTTWGRVTAVGSSEDNYFYIDDGSALQDGTGNRGVRVFVENMPPIPVGQHVFVTGLVNAAVLVGDESRIPMLIVAGPQDISPDILGLASARPAGAQAPSLDFIAP